MATQSWKNAWPTTRSVKAWIVASGRKALAIKDPAERIDKLGFAIERLAERGFKSAAKPLFAKFRRDVVAHPDVHSNVMLAKTFLAMGERDAAILMFAATIKRVKVNKKIRRARRAQELARLREDAVYLRLIEVIDDPTPAERADIDYHSTVEEAEAALKKGDRGSALSLAAKAEKALPNVVSLGKQWLPCHLLHIYAHAGDKHSALRMLELLEKKDRNVSTIGEDLLELGLKHLVVRLARREIRRCLDEARAMVLPNYHFPAYFIAGVIDFLIEHDELELARQEVAVILNEIDSWHVKPYPWVEAAVFSELSRPVARLDGRAVAEQMLDRARSAARAERSSSWRRGAWDSIIEVYKATGAWDDALAIARKQGSQRDRRKRQAMVLAKAGRTKEIAAILRDVETPEEAADVCWWVAGSLAGFGPPRR